MIAMVLATSLAAIVEISTTAQITVAQGNDGYSKWETGASSGTLMCWQEGYRIINLHNISEVRESRDSAGTRYTGKLRSLFGPNDTQFSIFAPAGSICIVQNDSDQKPFFWSWK